jgi:hypothetical protein
VNLKKFWVGHCILWIGILSGSPKCANAGTVALAELEPIYPQFSQTDRTISTIDSHAQPAAIALINSVELPSPSEQPKLLKSHHAIATESTTNIDWRSEKTATLRDKHNILRMSGGSPDWVARSPVSSEIDPDLQSNVSPVEVETPDEADAVDSDDPELEDFLPSQTQPETDTSATADPELGDLLLREPERILEVSEPDIDTVFLVGRADYFRSNNILLDSFDPVDDQLFSGKLSLLALPQLGSRTQLVASVGGGLARYSDLGELSYNDLDLRLGVQHTLFPNTYGEISWRNQQFFSTDDGDRFFNDHSVRFSLSHRQQLADQLSLDGYYQLRLSFTDPIDRSRVLNTLGASLNYNLQPDLDLGLDYQLTLTDFTQQQRNDDYHQVTAQLSYDLSQNSRISVFAGFSFGRSSDSDIDFDSSIFGIGFNTFIPLF